ncbi:hypothetical protein AA0472_1934 [Acetobacter estunensis NRIC 0472]|uniref:Uncharacterized protein n=1 Tax=Acetobacter estunensis TaxID=104097 RepID=A0A967EAJ4_9PROT|nr:hypothetical protein [Acetobacter estunensis]NHO52418.1 hypothetical protein [Acetobacter estunensis]GBQ25935.1 hypothetical protein AA0472_1934 [Acetobacter estunensis NRIC 0472]
MKGSQGDERWNKALTFSLTYERESRLYVKEKRENPLLGIVYFQWVNTLREST